ncbi:MAG TPA: DoxX family protein [Candidatus Sulfotelmatobacter sp.]|nr:DoxX family protein [Candidatus Sulfotelmatobacter sp.]
MKSKSPSFSPQNARREGGGAPGAGHSEYWDAGLVRVMYSMPQGGIVRYLDRLQPLALVAMRLALGVIMAAHGYHKVFGGLRQFSHMVGNMGIPAWLGYVAAFTELIGGLLVLAGFFTRLAAFALCIDLAVAIWKVHWHNGLMGTPDHPGFEFPLAAAALGFALMFFGGGAISIDHVLRGGGSGLKRS